MRGRERERGGGERDRDRETDRERQRDRERVPKKERGLEQFHPTEHAIYVWVAYFVMYLFAFVIDKKNKALPRHISILFNSQFIFPHSNSLRS